VNTRTLSEIRAIHKKLKENMEEVTMGSNDTTPELVIVQPVINNKDQFAFSQPVWHFIVLSILTFGIYDIYWYYRNWKYIVVYKSLGISPGWRTVGLFVPILNLFLIYGAHKDYKNLIREEGINRDIYPGRITLVIVITGILTRLPDPFWLLCFLATIPLAIVQGILNELWRKVQPDRIHRSNFLGRQIFLRVLGIIFWLLIIIGMVLPE
jgi:hypothetical protein